MRYFHEGRAVYDGDKQHPVHIFDNTSRFQNDAEWKARDYAAWSNRASLDKEETINQ